MSSTGAFLTTFPSVSAAWIFAVFVIVPIIPLLIGVHLISKSTRWRGGAIKSFFCNFALLIIKYAPIIAFGNIFWTFIISINQGSFLYSKITYQNDIFYYKNVDISSYHDSYYFNTAESTNSLLYYRALNIPNSNLYPRLSVVYHTNDWNNLLNNQTLTEICLSEQKILNEITCLNTTFYKSIIPKIFDMTTCSYYTSFNKSIAAFGLKENSFYLEDEISPVYPKSSILISYFQNSQCYKYSFNGFDDLVSSKLVGTQLQSTIVDKDFLSSEFKDLAYKTNYSGLVSILVAMVIMFIGLRGIGVAITTVYCMGISFIYAGAFLPLFNFSGFSAFNVLTIPVVIGYGAVGILMYSSAWRKFFRPGVSASVPGIIDTYRTFGQAFFLITLTAILSLFSLLASPILMLQQFGAFCGMSIISFYISFHYIVIPMWIYTSWFRLPLKFHLWLERQSLKYCGNCVLFRDNHDHESNRWTTATIMARQGHAHDDDMEDEDVEEEATVVTADHVQIANENTPQPSRSGQVSRFSNIFTLGSHQHEDILAANPVSDRHQSEQEVDVENNELVEDVTTCRGKRPLKILGFFFLLLVISILIVVYFLTASFYSYDYGFPQLFYSDSNIGKSLTIFKSVKQSIYDSNLFISALPSTPYTSPVSAPSNVATPPSSSNVYVDYTMKTCWGLAGHTQYKDSSILLDLSYDNFLYYMNNGLVADIQGLCNYVNANRDYLNVNPTWDMARDCIYNQYLLAKDRVPTGYKTVSNALINWGNRDTVSSSLLGILSNTSTSNPRPVWLCGNFSLRSYVDNFFTHSSIADQVQSRWETALNDHGAVNANQLGIPYFAVSNEFTYPILNSQTQYSIQIIASISISGFVVLLWIFTLSDFGLTILGSLGIFTIFAISVCLHIFIYTTHVNILDIVIVASCMSMIASFPIYLMEDYMTNRAIEARQETTIVEKNLNPSLAKTNRFIRPALIFPALVVVIVGIPAVYSPFRIFVNVGQYLFIIGVVSYLFSAFFQPYLLAFGCRTKICESYCYIEEDEEDYYLPDPNDEANPSPEPAQRPISTVSAYNDTPTPPIVTQPASNHSSYQLDNLRPLSRHPSVHSMERSNYSVSNYEPEYDENSQVYSVNETNSFANPNRYSSPASIQSFPSQVDMIREIRNRNIARITSQAHMIQPSPPMPAPGPYQEPYAYDDDDESAADSFYGSYAGPDSYPPPQPMPPRPIPMTSNPSYYNRTREPMYQQYDPTRPQYNYRGPSGPISSRGPPPPLPSHLSRRVNNPEFFEIEEDEYSQY